MGPDQDAKQWCGPDHAFLRRTETELQRNGRQGNTGHEDDQTFEKFSCRVKAMPDRHDTVVPSDQRGFSSIYSWIDFAFGSLLIYPPGIAPAGKRLEGKQRRHGLPARRWTTGEEGFSNGPIWPCEW